jgi:hypothetical protein
MALIIGLLKYKKGDQFPVFHSILFGFIGLKARAVLNHSDKVLKVAFGVASDFASQINKKTSFLVQGIIFEAIQMTNSTHKITKGLHDE